MALTLFTDTDCDMNPQMAEEYGYRLISMPYSLGDSLVFPWEDYSVFDAHAFYEELRKGAIPKTSSVSPERYREYFAPEFAAGNDILYVHFSSAMSSTFEAMHLAVRELKEAYPERSFDTIDTLTNCNNALNILLEIGDLYRQGLNAGELVAWGRENVQHFAGIAFVDNLKHLVRGGRISSVTGAVGDLLSMKPVIVNSAEGTLVNIDKTRGRKNAYHRLIQYMEERADRLAEHRIVISHTDAPQMAKELTLAIRERFGEGLNILLIDLNPTVGSHLGPDAVSVSFHATHR